MSLIFIDNDNNDVIDILENRNKRLLSEYLERLDLKNRKKVKKVNIEMYEKYVRLFREIFNNEDIIFERLNIVKNLNREINKYSVKVMNE